MSNLCALKKKGGADAAYQYTYNEWHKGIERGSLGADSLAGNMQKNDSYARGIWWCNEVIDILKKWL